MTEALAEYRHKGGVPDKTSTVEFLGAGERSALTDRSGKFRVSLYKILLYVEIADAIKSGALNLLHSEKYRSLDDYLIPREDWVANRADYLKRAQLKGMVDCRATLDSIDRRLDAHYRHVNRRLAAGENPHLTVRPNGSFHVKTPKLEDVESLSLGFFFPERKYIPLFRGPGNGRSGYPFPRRIRALASQVSPRQARGENLLRRHHGLWLRHRAPEACADFQTN